MVAGSQNGFDNSGRRGDVHWVSEDYPQDNANVARTIIIQDKIAANMARWIEEGAFKRETLYGISLLNEPAGWWDKVYFLEIVSKQYLSLAFCLLTACFSDDTGGNYT